MTIPNSNYSPLDLPRDISQMVVAGPYSLRTASRKFLSSKKDTPYINFGGNRQNIEKGMRIIWIADAGYNLIQCDQSGADALIVAYLCRNGKYRSLFLNGIKPHVYLALHLFPEQWKKRWDKAQIEQALVTPIPELKQLPFWKALVEKIKDSDNWPPQERFYFLGKKSGHAGNYGMMGNRLQSSILEETYGEVVLERKLADQMIQAIHIEFPEIRIWHSDIFRQAMQQKCLRNLFGFPLNITWEVRPDDMKDLYAWIPQSTVACITKTGFIQFQEYVEDNNRRWHMLQETHDSLLPEAPEGDETIECARYLKTAMEQKLIAPDGTIFNIKSEIQVGKNWAPRKEKKDKEGNIIEIINPEGLFEPNFKL